MKISNLVKAFFCISGEKIEKKDIIFIIWGFFGSCIVGSLLIITGLGYLTGMIVIISNTIGSGIIIIGLAAFPTLIILGTISQKKYRKNREKEYLNLIKEEICQ